MNTTAINTSDFILEKVAPIFNKQGYAGTSLSDINLATGLTKGAIYFYFKNKEELAIKAFKFNVKKVILPLAEKMSQHKKAVDKLQVLIDHYRNYYDIASLSGGCPILNCGTDTNHVNPALFSAVKTVTMRLENDLVIIIQQGIDEHDIKPGIDARRFGKNIYSMIEGSAFMAFTHNDKTYLSDMMDVVEQLVGEKMIK